MTRTKIRIVTLAAGVLGLSLVGLGLSGTFAAGSQASTLPAPMPVNSVAEQDAYAAQVSTFLATHPQPSMPSTDDPAIQNAYWKSEVAFWDSVPWKAVAGQWGCSFQSYQASFNPTDSDGVRSAGYGTLTNCGPDSTDSLTAVVSQPISRVAAISQDSALATPAGREASH